MSRSQIPPTLDREPLGDGGERLSRVTRFGAVVGGGVLAAIVASIPAELRIGGGSIATWLVLSAVFTPFGIMIVLVFRRARVGLRHLVGDRASVLAFSVLAWAVLELAVLSVFGALLRAKTHHHGLAGVSFAIFALVSAFFIALVVRRGAVSFNRAGSIAKRVALAVASVAAFASLVLIVVTLVRAPEPATAAALVDALALLLASYIASSRGFARVRWIAIAGVPLAAGVLLVGLRAEPSVRDAVAKHAPLHAWIVNAARSH
ncbi:MAG: hypothetical protein FWD69_01590 [Polyangiaceae bacterium]|nr:hypothetical protein [Polyangiaceae bacterium]